MTTDRLIFAAVAAFIAVLLTELIRFTRWNIQRLRLKQMRREADEKRDKVK